jgi:hypothetical protein
MLSIALAAACGSKATPPPASPEPARVEESASAATAVGAACASKCRGRYAQVPDRAAFDAYCDELCVPGTHEPEESCVRSCEAHHEPGAHYDDSGEYVPDEDTRDEEQIAADADECRTECSSVPVISDESMSACVDACTAQGFRDGGCKTDCDPDPYDECRYDPCD